ncbi:hypothetical protein [Romboutsia sp. MSSM.1001216sp_RTP31141st1_G3_RTP31141_220114]|uniref:hypothetical protein n=1 Tax=unclassified Romboutsia TaxID=2626894 RepID=UPI0031B5773F
MEKQILDLLNKIDEKLSNIEKEQQDMKSEIRLLNDKVDNLEIKANIIDSRIIRINKKLDSTNNQVARNMEVVEDRKMKLQ